MQRGYVRDRSGPQKLDSFFRVFKCTVASGYAALGSGFSFVEYVVGRSVVKSLVRPLFVEVAQVIGNPLPGLAHRLVRAPVDFFLLEAAPEALHVHNP